MEKRVKVHEFDPQIYPRKLWICHAPIKLDDRFKGVSDFNENALATVDCVTDTERELAGCLIRFCNKNAMTYANICHESIHVAINILADCGVEITPTNQEALAYLAGWCAKCCEKVKNFRNEKSETKDE
jgi:hypothetical protein